MSDLLEDLLGSIDRALVLVKSHPEGRTSGDIENLLRVKRVLEALDPAEIDALLEDEEE